MHRCRGQAVYVIVHALFAGELVQAGHDRHEFADVTGVGLEERYQLGVDTAKFTLTFLGGMGSGVVGMHGMKA